MFSTLYLDFDDCGLTWPHRRQITLKLDNSSLQMGPKFTQKRKILNEIERRMVMGWDFDEPSGAPGSVPQEFFIQTTFVHRSENKQQKEFATLILTKLGEVRQRLKQQARLTIDNEVISCVEDSEHYRCGEYQQEGSYHYLVVEDSAKGAAVYSLEQKLNENNPGATEMAILE
ncbi:hypothetical protein NECAME_02567 [Necator americanus]|uniref:Uncharacterized protein n=1 Tax=Necator americanus TaxID=51031 RepID=W2TDS5_NECAM|nr:hypothetical protein NECAME_02567 [Necator americanus]ETN79744.1 hypothetical protein NECAME_02567 [Necator americanus]